MRHDRGAITVLRGAQAAFLLDGTLLEIDPDAFAADHEAHAGAPAINATATLLRSYPEPHLAAAGALASATRANAEQIAELTLASVARADAPFASGHRITPPFRSLLAAQTFARRAAGAEDAEPLFLTRDNSRPATPRHVRNWLVERRSNDSEGSGSEHAFAQPAACQLRLAFRAKGDWGRKGPNYRGTRKAGPLDGASPARAQRRPSVTLPHIPAEWVCLVGRFLGRGHGPSWWWSQPWVREMQFPNPSVVQRRQGCKIVGSKP
jgi:hypothetical protein